MDDHKDIPLGAVRIPNIQYECSKSFMEHSQQQERDSNFLGTGRKKRWVHSSRDEHTKREILQTLVTTEDGTGEDCVEKLMAENISYRDLSSLVDKDLELMGFKSSKQRAELLELFKLLPNQDPTYEEICRMPEAQEFNAKIVKNATEHLDTMRAALAVANYKLKLNPPLDVVVGEKNFASRFVLEALKELDALTMEVEKELRVVEELTKEKQQAAEQQAADKERKKKLSKLSLSLWLTTASIAAVCGVWYFKIKKL